MVSKKTVVAPIGAESDERLVLSTLDEFAAERMVLLASLDGITKAEKLAAKLKGMGVDSSVVKVRNADVWQDFYKALASVCKGMPKSDVIVNVSASDRMAQCALTSAAHMNGLKAVVIVDGKIMHIPIMNLAYGEFLSDSKIKILRTLDPHGLPSLEAVSRRSGMSLQLVSYHVNGSPQSKGLKGLELIEATEEKGRVRVQLTPVGRLFLDGHINED